MFFDKKRRILFLGDSIARRLLLFDIDEEKVKSYIQKIREMKKYGFEYICSSHDRVPLYKEYIDYMFEQLSKMGDKGRKTRLFGGRFGEFCSFKIGDEAAEEFLSCSIVAEYKSALIKAASDIIEQMKTK